MTRIKKRILLFSIGVGLFLIFGMIISFSPLLWMILSAFKTEIEILQVPPTWIPQEWRWTNFTEVFDLQPIFLYMRNSLIVTLTMTFGNLITSSLAGYALAKTRFPARDKIFLLIVATMMVPSFLYLIPQFMTVKFLGWLDSWVAIIVPAMASPFNIFLIRQFIIGMPEDLFDSARMDGCSDVHIWWKIVLPLCKPVLATMGIVSFFFGWDSFLWPFIVLRSQELFTLPIGLRILERATLFPPPRYNLMMAGFVISTIPVLVAYAIAQKQIVEGITITGLKA